MLKPFYQENFIEAGCDEAGRGCLAGPVFAAAVILPKDFNDKRVNDSKQLSFEERVELRKVIEEIAISWAVAAVDNEQIDKINILNASILAMHHAVEKLHIQPGFLLIDGNRFKPFKNIPFECIIKGDGKYYSIAAASILAKTHRDEYMKKIGLKYPVYKWARNKGYPTHEHREAIKIHGSTPYHRKSFRLLPEKQRELDLN